MRERSGNTSLARVVDVDLELQKHLVDLGEVHEMFDDAYTAIVPIAQTYTEDRTSAEVVQTVWNPFRESFTNFLSLVNNHLNSHGRVRIAGHWSDPEIWNGFDREMDKGRMHFYRTFHEEDSPGSSYGEPHSLSYYLEDEDSSLSYGASATEQAIRSDEFLGLIALGGDLESATSQRIIRFSFDGEGEVTHFSRTPIVDGELGEHEFFAVKTPVISPIKNIDLPELLGPSESL